MNSGGRRKDGPKHWYLRVLLDPGTLDGSMRGTSLLEWVLEGVMTRREESSPSPPLGKRFLV